MKEIRLTVRADDFVAISQILVDRGVGFRVEPIIATEPEVAPRRASAPPKAKARKPAKKVGRGGAKRGAKTDDLLGTGADRLREAIARTGTTAAPATAGSSERPYANPAADTVTRSSPGEGGA